MIKNIFSIGFFLCKDIGKGGILSEVKTQILTEILEAVRLLKNGGLVAIPTETVYGLAAKLFDPSAILKIYHVKGRPSDNPLIAHISDLEMAEMITSKLSEDARILASHFWPGPLTLVLPKKLEVPLLASAGLDTIGIRMPRHADALKIISQVGEPLVAPSANLSGRPSPTQVRDVLEDLDGRIDAVFEGGECEVGIESTILCLAGDRPTLLRPGAILRNELETVLGKEIGVASDMKRALAPGMKYRHYAPRAKIEIIRDLSEAKGTYILAYPTRKTLYQSFREADRQQIPLISILIDSNLQKDEGLMNRIEKAARDING